MICPLEAAGAEKNGHEREREGTLKEIDMKKAE